MDPTQFWVDSQISAYFGNNADYYGHSGVDHWWPAGTVIPSPGVGLVHHAGWTTSHGFYLSVQYHEWFLKFCHQPDLPSEIAGWRGFGDSNGEIGLTGATTGYHVHTEMSLDPVPGPHAQRYDPLPFLRELMVEGQAVRTAQAAFNIQPLSSKKEDDDMPLILRTVDGPYKNLGVVLGTRGVTVSTGIDFDRELQDLYGQKEAGPFDLVTHAGLIVGATIFDISEDDIANAAKNHGQAFRSRR